MPRSGAMSDQKIENPNQPEPETGKKRWEKPQIKGSGAFEKQALACALPDTQGEPGCLSPASP